MKKKFSGIIALLLFASTIGAIAQDEQNKPREASTEPLELPNFIIRGIEQLNVRSGIKQFPGKPAALTAGQLDSLNTLEKQQPALMPAPEEPDQILSPNFRQTYVEAGFGRFMTGHIGGAFEADYAGYDFHFRGDLEHSDGHIEGARYDRAMIDLSAVYVAPDKYWIFGGSMTRTRAKFNNRNFDMYASPAVEQRNITDFDISVDVEGSYQGFGFDLGGGFESTRMSTIGDISTENSINGYISVENLWRKFYIGGGAKLDIRSLDGQWTPDGGAMTNFAQIEGYAAYTIDKTTFRGRAGFQFANNSADVSRAGLLLDAGVEYRMNKFFTLEAGACSGLENNSFSEILKYNPYLSDSAFFDYKYNIVRARGAMKYHPDDDFGFSMGTKLGAEDRIPVMAMADTGFFAINYMKGYIAGIFAELFWSAGPEDDISALLELNYARSDAGSKSIPYVAPIEFSIIYGHQWAEYFGTDFGINYTGERYADIENKEVLTGYVNVTARARFEILKEFTAILNFENLTNSDIFIWQGYKQRGLFVSLNLMWHL
ncbi:MAG: hypothetical protein ACLFQX_08165 [Candidatus Kapaibacterium sp.]